MSQTPAGRDEATKASAEASEAEEHARGEDDEKTSDLEAALFKMMRMQYGLLAGGAKGVTEMAKMMETFVESLADETDLKTTDDWRALIESTPDALVNASRKAMDRGDQAAKAVVDTYRRYSEAKG